MPSSKLFHAALREWAEVFMHRSMRESMRYVRGTGLSLPQFNVMMKLFYRGGCGVSEISSHMDVTAAAASQLVDGLVQKGYLARVEAEHDRRAKQITLTADGRALIEKGIEARSGWTRELTQHLDAERLEALGAALKQLAEAAKKLEIKDEG